jgi:hypothetical protein
MWYAWERREYCTRFWWGIKKERDLLEDRAVNGRMGTEWILGRLDVVWVQLAQITDQWRAVVNVVMNLRVMA